MTAAGTPPGKAWSGRFTEGADPTAEAFTSSLSFDRRLWPYDLVGQRGVGARPRAGEADHAPPSWRTCSPGSRRCGRSSRADRFPFRRELEDIHMNVERRLVELAGSVGGKLHTGRSRNDQIALDERLYLRDVIDGVDAGLREVQRALVAQAEKHREAPMPGYTHLQRAQPVLLAHHLLAYVFMLERDRQRFRDCRARVNVMPLGAAALAGTAFAIDREALARDLGMSGPSANSMDAVADRDFLVEFLAHAAIVGMHGSRLAADLTLWATAEFGFVEFSDAFATGSSIMPQKKNPDVAELVRGKTGRLYGNLTAALTTMKGLPLTYNSDMQEDKEPLFDTVDTLEAIFRVLPPMLGSLTFRVDRMREAAGAHYSTATDLADYLVRQGLPFREAHEVVGKAVRHAITRGRELGDLPIEELRQFSPLIGRDVYAALTVEASLRARGGDGRHRPRVGAAAARAGPGLARARARRVSPATRRRLLALCLAVGALAACGKKGPPVAPEVRVPTTPAALRGAVDEQSIVVSWNAPGTRLDGTRLRAIALYRLYRREEADAGPAKSAMLSSGHIVGYDEVATIRPEAPAPATVQGGSVTWVDRRALSMGRRYVYVVTAEDNLGRTSGPSERLIVPFLAAPPAPRGLTATPGDRSVSLAWQAPETTGSRGGGRRGDPVPGAARGRDDRRSGPDHGPADRGHDLHGYRRRQRRGLPLRGARGPGGGRGQRDGGSVDADRGRAGGHHAARRAHRPGRGAVERSGAPGLEPEPGGGRGDLRGVPGGRDRGLHAHRHRGAARHRLRRPGRAAGRDLPVRGHRHRSRAPAQRERAVQRGLGARRVAVRPRSARPAPAPGGGAGG